MKTSAIPVARKVIQLCKQQGIRHIVISPGSRNAPLTLGFTADPYFRCYSIVDERCAAFFALGLAQQLRHGVAVVCTSGSALLNYYPAVAEAFYSHLPLIVISADRPPYKIDIGDGQTIRQDHVFQRHIGFTALLKQDVTHATGAIRTSGLMLPEPGPELEAMQAGIDTHNHDTTGKALEVALASRLPVHLNVPFEEPLYEMREEEEQPSSVPEKQFDAQRYSIDYTDSLGTLWKRSSRKMVLIGSAFPGEVSEAFLQALAADPSVLVFTETTSNCHHPEFFPGIDNIIAPLEKQPKRESLFKDLRPELLLTLGGMVVSKKIKAFLRKHRPDQHWHLGRQGAYNTYYSLTRHIPLEPERFYDIFKGYMHPETSDYKARWAEVRDRGRALRAEYLGKIPFSDLLVFDRILDRIPQGFQVQLANSSTIRYTQLFDMHPSLRVFCNRGTSGIDGSTSTAIGASLAVQEPTVLISGDLSFLYDSNGLWNAYMRNDFRIIVINNQGGGIFRILPGKEESSNFETYFETVHQLDLKHVCQLYGLEHQRVKDEKGLNEALTTFYGVSDRPKLLEIQTPRQLNNEILLAYFEYLS